MPPGSAIEGYILELDDGNGGQYRVRTPEKILGREMWENTSFRVI